MMEAINLFGFAQVRSATDRTHSGSIAFVPVVPVMICSPQHLDVTLAAPEPSMRDEEDSNKMVGSILWLEGCSRGTL